MLSLFRSERISTSTMLVGAPRPLEAPKPPLMAHRTVKAEPACAATEALMEEYAQLAKELGVRSPDFEIERFKRFLFEKDLPIFNLAEVISYMNEKAEKESKEKAGWLWRPLRKKDELKDITFGKEATLKWGSDGRTRSITPASDMYTGPHEVHQSDSTGERHTSIRSGTPVYDRTVPFHALKRVALIEKEYSGVVSFFVSDYAPEPQIAQYPDPFLMVVIPNPNLNRGDGRLVIDFWDEPGFGIERMLK